MDVIAGFIGVIVLIGFMINEGRWMKDLIRRLQRLNHSIRSNGYKDGAILEAIEQLHQAHREGWEQCKMQQGMAQAYAEDNFSSRGKSVPRNGG